MKFKVQLKLSSFQYQFLSIRPCLKKRKEKKKKHPQKENGGFVKQKTSYNLLT